MFSRFARILLCFLLRLLKVKFSKNEEDALLYNKLICWLYVWCTRKRRYGPHDLTSRNPYKNGVLIRDEEYELEKCVASHDLQPNESQEIVLMALRSSSNEAVIVKLSRNSQNLAQVFVYVTTEDGTTYTLPKPEIVPDLSNNLRYHANGLRLQIKEPMRKWRIAYNGIMIRNDDHTRAAYVKFVFIWFGQSTVIDWQFDSPISLIVENCVDLSIAKTFANIEKYKNHLNGYEQNGGLMGTMSIDDNPEKEVFLFGKLCRIRNTYELEKRDLPETEHAITYEKHGEIIHVTTLKYPHDNKTFQVGSVFSVSCFKDPATKIDTQGDFLINQKNSRFSVSTFETTYGIEVLETKATTKDNFSTVIGYPGRLQVYQGSILTRGKPANILILTTKPDIQHENIMQVANAATDLKDLRYTQTSSTKKPLVTGFNEEECKNSNLTGGKGASLAVLTTLAGKNKTMFSVPPGVVVTTEAFSRFLLTIKFPIEEKLKTITSMKSLTEIKNLCTECSTKISLESMPASIQESLWKKLETMFPNDELNTVQFAVRSSAAGEDSEDMSAAGQMDSFLGVQGKKEIMKAVVKCWASQFTHIAVEYKRRYGQPLVSPMAVVVMKMVPSDIAGVLFTCDPQTGNPSQLFITANYGLGDSVVSAMTEPDTVRVKRDLEGNFVVNEVISGKKDVKVVLNESGFTRVEKLSEPELSCCISPEQSVELAEVGAYIEKCCGDPRDIEWAFFRGSLWLLQSRPVTFRDRPSKFEISHEMDYPSGDESPYLSMHNVGEVMNKALSPFGQDMVYKNCMCWTKLFMARQQRNLRYAVSEIGVSNGVIWQQHLIFDLVQFVRSYVPDPKNRKKIDAALINLCGETVNDPEFYRYMADKFDIPAKEHHVFISDIYRKFEAKHLSQLYLWWYEKRLKTVQIDTKDSLSCEQILTNIAEATERLILGIEVHLCATRGSSMYNHDVILLLEEALEGSSGDTKDIVYHDTALLLSSGSNVVSAEVPLGIRRLATLIVETDLQPERFANMNIEEAKRYLTENDTLVKTEFLTFVDKHQHRGYNEFDVYRKPYGMDQTPLIQNIQSMVRFLMGQDNKNSHKTALSITESIDKLKTPLSTLQKFWLRYYVYCSRSAIGFRERGKSLLIWTQHVIRKASYHLAERMQKEGYLPDAELFFFMSYYELRDLLKYRDPVGISRAYHRKRIFSELCDLKFPDFGRGPPKPLEPSVTNYTGDSVIMKGIAISDGEVKAKARVITNVEDAATIERGEVLITYATDIGWSPYFPLLGGIVTELGGLMSHGAVVAREYGLPCIVGLHGASNVFKTGDLVYLNAKNGTIQKINEKHSD